MNRKSSTAILVSHFVTALVLTSGFSSASGCAQGGGTSSERSHEVIGSIKSENGAAPSISEAAGGEAGTGGSPDQGGAAVTQSVPASTSEASSTDACDGVADGKCDYKQGVEGCGCSDCSTTALCNPGQCVTDGHCSLEDSCTCPDCDADNLCSNGCNGDGICDAFREGCGCSDCFHEANCLDNPNCGNGICQLGEPCDCVDCVDTPACQVPLCVNDGVCSWPEDACICADCDADPFCSDPNVCLTDGSCDAENEGCVCPDCQQEPLCADNG